MATAKLHRSYYHSFSQVPPLQHSLLELLDIRGDAHPDREAYIIRDIGKPRDSITYGQLKRRTMQLASAFIDQGLQKGDRVGLLCPTSIDYVVCEHALARAGCVVVRVTSVFKSGDDFKYLLKTSGVRWIIAHPGDGGSNFEILKQMYPRMSDHDPKTRLDIEELPDLETIFMLGDVSYPGTLPLHSIIKGTDFNSKKLLARQATISNDDICLLNITSGSTGFPKLVALSYSYGINASRIAMMRNGVTEKDIYISERSMSYSSGITFPAFGIGYTMVYVVTKSFGAGSRGSEFMFQCAEEENCTVMLMFQYTVVDFLRLKREGKISMSKMHTGVISGQIINRNMFAECHNYIPNMIDMYGTTEVNVCIGSLVSDALEKKLSTTGLPSDCEAKITDDDGNIVPINKPGELYIRNGCMFVKYWGDEEATEAAKTKDGWFRTDDVAKMDEYGYVTVLGRMKEIIIKAGTKVYPISLENTIIKHPKISQVVVIGVPDERLHEEICACVAPEKGETISKGEVREYCEEVFGQEEDGLSMCPRYFMLFERFPLGMTEKTDRRKLKEMVTERLGF